jgi:RNA polymerase sigma factor (TIGR02999 family)
VYEGLRKLAAERPAHEAPGQTLQATALVHEAYLRLVGSPGGESGKGSPGWDSRGHFFAAAAAAMRRILVERARRRSARKRGGELKRIDLPDLAQSAESDPMNLVALDDALKRLGALHPQKALVVKLRFFAGCSVEDTARMLRSGRATAQRHWAFARAWLYGKLKQA